MQLPREGSPSARLVKGWQGLAGIAAALVIWTAIWQLGWLPHTSFPSPGATGAAMARQLFTVGFWASTGETMWAWALGLVVATAVGIPVGVLMGSSRVVKRSCSLIVEFLKPIPPVALIPLGLLVWGPSLEMSVTLVAFASVWPILIQVIYGVQAVDPAILEMARSYRLSRRRTLASVAFPGLLPFVATGVRTSAAIALIVAVVTELIGGAAGLGNTLGSLELAGAIPEMYAYIACLGILGIIVNAIFSRGEGILLPWHPSRRAGRERT